MKSHNPKHHAGAMFGFVALRATSLSRPRTVQSEAFIPQCHHCRFSGLPFEVQLMECKQWAHRCGAIVCPACGGKVARGAALCLTCQRLAKAAQRSQR